MQARKEAVEEEVRKGLLNPVHPVLKLVRRDQETQQHQQWQNLVYRTAAREPCAVVIVF